MTPDWRLAAALGLLLALLGLLLANAALVCLTLPFAALTMAPFFTRFPRPRAAARSDLARLTTVEGRECTITVTITNEGPTLPYGRLRLVVPQGAVPVDCPLLVTCLRTGGTWDLHFRGSLLRGRHPLGPVRLETRDAMGLRSREELLPLEALISVLPRVDRIERLEVLPRNTGAGFGMVHARTGGAGAEFFGTREYAPGDRPRRVNWRATERWDRLVTNIYDEERSADIGIILDARSASEVRIHGSSLFEYSVRMAASLADGFLRHGNRVGLLCYGRGLEWVFPGYGREQWSRIMVALCTAAPSDHVVFAEFRNLPLRLFRPRSQLVVVSPVMTQDVPTLRYLRTLGFDLLVVSPDPMAFESGSAGPGDPTWTLARQIVAARRDAVFTMLRRSGARVVEWDTSVTPAMAVSRLGRVWRR
jgi:uncharacterized protein (DUF58 family)